MNRTRAYLSRRYLADLQQFLKHGPGASMKPAQAIGQLAVNSGIETLDIARIHEIAIASLILPNYTPETSGALLGRAAAFFNAALVPIEKTHRGAIEANIHLNHTIMALSQRTHELAESVSELKLEIIQRTEAEVALKISELTTSALLVKSLAMQDQLRHLSRQLLSVQEEERRKISRELHDVIAQSLSSINFRLAELKTDPEISREMLGKKIDSTQALVEKSVEIVHRFARELRPSVLDDLGLIPALDAHFTNFMQETGIHVQLTIFAGIEEADNSTLTILYRIAQEAFKNIARHAHATHAKISIIDVKDMICMEIRDNGIGFEVEGKSCAKKTIRLGLLGMKERAEMIGGNFSIESEVGKGTTIRIELPHACKATHIQPQKHHESHHNPVS